jgi:rubrerythrin
MYVLPIKDKSDYITYYCDVCETFVTIKKSYKTISFCPLCNSHKPLFLCSYKDEQITSKGDLLNA